MIRRYAAEVMQVGETRERKQMLEVVMLMAGRKPRRIIK
jgi:hypothetical protein